MQTDNRSNRILTIVWLLMAITAGAQSPAGDIDTIRLAAPPEVGLDITGSSHWLYLGHESLPEVLAKTPVTRFQPLSVARSGFPAITWGRNKSVGCRMVIQNTGKDTLQLMLFMERSHRLRLYRRWGQPMELLAVGGYYWPALEATRPHDKNYLPFVLRPGGTAELFLQRHGWFPYQNFPLFLVGQAQRDYAYNMRLARFRPLHIYYATATSLFLMLGFFALAQYYWSRDRAYLFYALFVFMHGLYALDSYDRFPGSLGLVSLWWPYFSVFAASKIQLAHLFYAFFILHFLNLHTGQQALGIQTRRFILIAGLLLPAIPLSYWLFNHQPTYNWVQIAVFAIIIPFGTIVIYGIARRRDTFSRIATASLGLYVGGSILGFLYSHGLMPGSVPTLIKMDNLLPTGLGVLAESICFFVGLSYRTKILQAEKISLMQQYTQQVEANVKMQQEMTEEKERLARDLHDEMGSTLSSISILSATINQPDRLKLIGERAREVMESMSDIIWSINSRNESVETMLERIKIFAAEALESQGIQLHFEAEPSLHSLALRMEHRKDIYLICKEAINNAAKYSGATEVRVSAAYASGLASFAVRDNGRGFDPSVIKRGNGLTNMQRRAAGMGAELHLETAPDQGTSMVLTVRV